MRLRLDPEAKNLIFWALLVLLVALWAIKNGSDYGLFK